MLALQTPHGTGHVIILKVSLGVCTLIKQENGLCGPGRENERKGEWNYRPGWLHKSCISCFMACQKNSTPVDHRSYNCTWIHREGVGGELRFVCHWTCEWECVRLLGVCAYASMFFLAWTGFYRQSLDDRRKLRECLLFTSLVHPGWAAHSPQDLLTEPSFTIVITLFIYPTCFWWWNGAQFIRSRQFGLALAVPFTLIKWGNQWIINHKACDH